MADRSPSRVFIHPDFLVLEEALAKRAGEMLPRADDDAFAPVLILAPSQRQVERLRERLAELWGAAVGVEVQHFQAVAYRLAGLVSGDGELRLAPRALSEALVQHLLLSGKNTPLATYAVERPGAVSALASLLRELREAGVASGDLGSLTGGTARELAGLLSGMDDALEALQAHGWTDRAGLLRRAREGAANAPPYRAVYAYGAYDLIGGNLELLRALPVTGETALFVPCHPEAPAWAYARGVIKRTFGVAGEPVLSDEGERPSVAAGAALFVADKTPTTFSGFSLAHAQGTEAELTYAAREALRLVGEGVPPHEIGILARTLKPYASLAETVFARHGLPVDSSLTLPLHRYPKARTLLLLCRALEGEFKRQTVIDLFRSPAFKYPEPVDGVVRRPASQWDQWSRRYRVVRGAEAWTRDLPKAVGDERPPENLREDVEAMEEFERLREERAASLDQLKQLVALLDEARGEWLECKSAAAHREFLEGLGERWVHGWNQVTSQDAVTEMEVNRALLGSLAELESLDALALVPGFSKKEGLSAAKVLDLLEKALAENGVPWREPGGVAFLDVMQARGRTFKHLYLIGFNSGVFPRVPREDVFLPDRHRRALRDSKGVPLSISAEADDEERLLLAQTLAAARDTATVTWQRTDASGRERSPSLFLREISRLLPGAPSLEAVLGSESRAVTHLPTHPAKAAEWYKRHPKLLSLEECAVLTCDGAGLYSADALQQMVKRMEPVLLPRVQAGFRAVAVLESNDPERMLFNGDLPKGSGWDRRFSPSALQRMGRCPTTFFFRDVLRVRAMDESADDKHLQFYELGLLVHEVLESVFCDIKDANALSPEYAEGDAMDLALKSIKKHWQRITLPAAVRIKKRFPGLWQSLEEQWLEELELALRKDIARLRREGQEIEGVESLWEHDLPLDELVDGVLAAGYADLVEGLPRNEEGQPILPVLGRVDRITKQTRDFRLLITDYKTSGKLENRVKNSETLRGEEVQLLLYQWIAEEKYPGTTAQAELMGVGPFFYPDKGFARTDPVQARLKNDAMRGFRESLMVLAAMAAKGRFPINPAFRCQFCDFRLACRRYHPNSQEAISTHPGFTAYAALRKKRADKKPLLLSAEDPS